MVSAFVVGDDVLGDLTELPVLMLGLRHEDPEGFTGVAVGAGHDEPLRLADQVASVDGVSHVVEFLLESEALVAGEITHVGFRSRRWMDGVPVLVSDAPTPLTRGASGVPWWPAAQLRDV